MLSEKMIKKELRNCVESLFHAETMKAKGTRTLSSMGIGILTGKIEAYEMVLELERGDTSEQAHQAQEAHNGELEDNSD